MPAIGAENEFMSRIRRVSRRWDLRVVKAALPLTKLMLPSALFVRLRSTKTLGFLRMVPTRNATTETAVWASGTTARAAHHREAKIGVPATGSAPGTFRPSQWGFSRRNRPSSDDSDETPQEIQKWNWSAFILGPIWGVVHGLWWTILGFMPLLPVPTLRTVGFIVLISVMLILGLKGNEMAWRARQWESPEKFLAVQQRWATWSIVFAIGAFVSVIIFLLGQG